MHRPGTEVRTVPHQQRASLCSREVSTCLSNVHTNVKRIVQDTLHWIALVFTHIAGLCTMWLMCSPTNSPSCRTYRSRNNVTALICGGMHRMVCQRDDGLGVRWGLLTTYHNLWMGFVSTYSTSYRAMHFVLSFFILPYIGMSLPLFLSFPYSPLFWPHNFHLYT
jgi:hypothetical protein